MTITKKEIFDTDALDTEKKYSNSTLRLRGTSDR